MKGKQAASNERPILFSGDLVRAIFECRKTQTRRIVKPQPAPKDRLRGLSNTADGRRSGGVYAHFVDPEHQRPYFIRCPYGAPGDRLWVREAWATPDEAGSVADLSDHRALPVLYRAGGERGRHPPHGGADAEFRWGPVRRWRPSIHMPRWASRLLLEVTAIGVERLQDITEVEAEREGCTWHAGPYVSADEMETPRGEFKRLWNALNDKRAPWEANPWVWVVSFEIVEGHADES